MWCVGGGVCVKMDQVSNTYTVVLLGPKGTIVGFWDLNCGVVWCGGMGWDVRCVVFWIFGRDLYTPV